MRGTHARISRTCHFGPLRNTRVLTAERGVVTIATVGTARRVGYSKAHPMSLKKVRVL